MNRFLENSTSAFQRTQFSRVKGLPITTNKTRHGASSHRWKQHSIACGSQAPWHQLTSLQWEVGASHAYFRISEHSRSQQAPQITFYATVLGRARLPGKRGPTNCFVCDQSHLRFNTFNWLKRNSADTVVLSASCFEVVHSHLMWLEGIRILYTCHQ